MSRRRQHVPACAGHRSPRHAPGLPAGPAPRWRGSACRLQSHARAPGGPCLRFEKPWLLDGKSVTVFEEIRELRSSVWQRGQQTHVTRSTFGILVLSFLHFRLN